MKKQAGRDWRCGDRILKVDDRPLLMGILNVTPDSFSDGGRYVDTDAAVARARQMVGEGADIIDVGGESTRPGAAAVSVREEAERVVPVIRALVADCADAVVSVDTRKAAVAAAAVQAGARIINDVSAMTHDPAIVEVARASGAGVVLMHMRGDPETMQDDPAYTDVVADVGKYLHQRVAALTDRGGLALDSLVIDPGIGFGKTVEHNLDLLANLAALAIDGRPVLVGASRKSTIGVVTGRPVGERLPGSLAVAVYAVINGARILRVHDVAETSDAMRMLAAIQGKARGTGVD